MPNDCSCCENGIISWDKKSATYLCDNCNFQYAPKSKIAPKKHIPNWNFEGKPLGSFIHSKRTETDLELRLRKLHKGISQSAEWERRINHFEFISDMKANRILQVWNARMQNSGGESGAIDKSKIVISMARDLRLPYLLICNVLEKEKIWLSAGTDVCSYQRAMKFGTGINRMWKLYGGPAAVKSGELTKLSAIIDKISQKLHLNPYSVTTILRYSGAWAGGNWMHSTYQKLQENGVMVARLYENKKNRVKDEWTLCEIVDGISKVVVGTNPYYILSALVHSGQVNLNPNTAHTIYSKYKYAKKSLALIKEQGPKTVKEVAKEFRICERVASYAFELLEEKKLVQVHNDWHGVRYFYLAGQEEQLRATAPHLKLEDVIMNSGKLYVTSHAVMRLQTMSESYAAVFLNKLALAGKLIKLNDVKVNVKEKVYVILNSQPRDEAVRNAVSEVYAEILKNITSDGIRAYSLVKLGYAASNARAKRKLEILEKYGLVKREGRKYYLK